MSDDTLYSLLRRFNKQVTAIRAAEIPPTRLDFSPAPDEAFDPDKLRSNVERIYLTVVKDLMTLGKHLMLLRSWDNPMRTGSFASASLTRLGRALSRADIPRVQAYFIAWQSPFGAVSFLFLILALLILYPSVRTFLFPPLPTPRPSQVLVDKPPRDPTLTSAEQDEVDARVFAEGMAQLAGAGQMSGGDPTLEDVVNEAVEEAEIDVEVDEEEGASASEEKKKRKKEKKKKDKVDHLAKVGLPIQLLTSDFADSWERWGNALSPTSPPLHPNAARMKVALHVLPCILAFGLLPSWFICKALSFLAGLAFFGDPGFSLLLALLDQKFEGWKEAIELRQ